MGLTCDAVALDQAAEEIKQIVHGPSKHSRDRTHKWLAIHGSRMLMADIPSWICFLLAAIA